MKFAKFMSNLTFKCYLSFSLVILPNLVMYTNATPDKNIATNITNFILLLIRGKTPHHISIEFVEKYSKRVSSLFIFSIQNILQKECLIKIYSSKKL